MAQSSYPSAAKYPYDIAASVPDFKAYLREYSAASARTREAIECRLDIAYGKLDAEKLDLFPAPATAAPLVVFLHGGAWSASSKSDRSFPAEVFVPQGVSFISLEYPLAPAHSLDQIVKSARTGLSWIWKNAADLGIDRSRIVVCGNSAGGHLTGMILARGWHGAQGVPEDWIRGACTLSGVFDMEPLRHGSRAQSWLKMDADCAARNSPIRHVPSIGCPFLGVVGRDEPGVFVGQTMAFCTEWAAAGHAVDAQVMDGQNHFSIIGELGRSQSGIVAWILERLRD